MINIKFSNDLLTDFHEACEKEWLVPNGLGGYASSSACGANTRKYHGLLIAAFNPPVDRYLMLSKLEEELSTKDREFFLSCNLYSNGIIQPRGHLYLDKFELTPDPVYTYKINDDIIFTKKIFTLYGRNTTVIKYTLESAPQTFDLKLYPLVTFRNFHSNTDSRSPGFNYSINHLNRHLKITFNSSGGETRCLYLTSDKAVFKRNEVWNRGFILKKEIERGENFSEDLLCPGRFKTTLTPGASVSIIASTEENADETSVSKLEKQRAAKIFEITNICGAPALFTGVTNKLSHTGVKQRKNSLADLYRTLTFTADSFIVRRASTGKKSIIAGYHWFSDWGRDTMISLGGLTLVTGRFEISRDILTTFAENIKNGLVPNRFNDDSAMPPEYNAADASLWYVHALYKYYLYTGDWLFIQKNLRVIEEIIDNYISGCDFNIKMDAADSLISQGCKDIQLTWMDAKIDDLVVTPRSGKAVEINALWYNALCIYKFFEEISIKEGEKEKQPAKFDKYDYLIKEVKKNFETRFVNPDGGLYDIIDTPEIHVNKENRNISDQIRPNQIFAVSLPFTPLEAQTARNVVNTVERHLLTERGLRTLAKHDTQYEPRYEGGRLSRDKAYHQGTVWPYLTGPFISAKLRVNKYDDETLDFCSGLIDNFSEHLKEAGLMSISEIFDAEAPRRPAGCISQAWSVAELLRALHEDILGNQRLKNI